MRGLAYILFYPTLWWNRALCRLNPRRHWWDWIDEWVLLGALPTKKDVAALRAAGIGAVVNTCNEYRGPLASYQAAGIEQLYLPTTDFTPPRLEDIQKAVAFMQAQVARGHKVYVHCKAGRGRSATLVLCYLIAKGLTPAQAEALLLEKRPHVLPQLLRRKVVEEFVARRTALKNATAPSP